MTYTALTASTLVSDTPDILNGVTTREVAGIMGTGPGTTAAEGVASGLLGWEFTLNDDATLVFPIPPRVDITVAPTLRLALAPVASEVGRSVALTFASDTVTIDSSVVAGTGAQSSTTSDILLADILGTVQVADAALVVDVWDAVPGGFILGKLSRVAIGAGTELAADLSVLGASLVYTIER